MLVLTRKQDQTIRIGNNVTITIIKVRGNTVRIGIDAPREVPVVRGELDLQTNSVEQNSNEPITLEFKTNPSLSKEKTRLTVVDKPENTQAPAIYKPQNRLQELVSKVVD